MDVNFTTEKCNGTNSAGGGGVRHDGIWLCPCGGALLLYYKKKEHRIKEQSTTNQRKNGGAVFKNTFSSILTHTYRTHSCSALRVR